MKISKALLSLSLLTALLALIQSGLGLFWQDGGSPFNFTTLHGQTVQMYGQGIYAFDTSFKAPILRGTDAVTLFLCIPLLVIAALLYVRGSMRGGLLLAGVLAYFVYNSTSLALGAAYNNLFLLYVADFSASMFAFVLALRSINVQALAARLNNGVPRRGIAILLAVAGLAVFVAWLSDILAALVSGGVPAIASYTSDVTYVIDLGIIAPLCFLTGILLLRRSPVSYLLAAILLTLLSIVGAMVCMQTVFQLQAGISLTPGEIVGKTASFILLAMFAVWLLLRLMRCISGPGSRQSAV